MTKLQEILNKIASLKKTAEDYLDKNDNDNAKKTLDEIKGLKEQAEMQRTLDELEKNNVSENHIVNVVTEKPANFIRAAIKKFAGKTLTEKENALLLPSTTYPEGANGEGYILPQDIQTKINKLVREYKSMREVCGYMKTTALSGSFPVENFETVSGLIDFEDGTDGTYSNDIKFKSVPYKLAEKAALIQLSNTLLALSDNDLIAYVSDIFAKKAIVTENAMAIDKITEGKTVKTLKSWLDLKSSLNVDIDPAMLNGTVIVTNQDGFDYLDRQLDSIGRPILNSDVANSTQKTFAGYPVKVFSNAMLPSNADGTAPIFYGNLSQGVKFVDLGITKFATSEHAGFLSNTTIARMIEFVTVVQCDSSDKCYVCGKLTLADTE